MYTNSSLPPSLTHAHVVQLKDVQGHLYNLVNATVRFSEPQNEPIPDAKLRMELANVVRNMTSLKNGKVPSTIEVGNIKAQGKIRYKRRVYTCTVHIQNVHVLDRIAGGFRSGRRLCFLRATHFCKLRKCKNLFNLQTLLLSLNVKLH